MRYMSHVSESPRVLLNSKFTQHFRRNHHTLVLTISAGLILIGDHSGGEKTAPEIKLGYTEGKLSCLGKKTNGGGGRHSIGRVLLQHA